MKAFLVGLVALIAASLFFWLGMLLFPLLVVLGLVVRILIVVVLLGFAIWLLGKFIIYAWQKVK
ncbi:MAG: hypothetical protein JW869_08140 [Candidatus Omnitrophica bacterium]|nr:hypothetical protein [Candidatus Omnitrophota bacterium]